MTLEQKKLERLYELMRREERAGHEEAATDLRWAIFELERIFGRKQ